MTTVPTTTFGSWANITTYSLSPAQYVADGLADYVTDYDVEAITGELLTQLQARLPAGLTILGNGELIGPASGPEHDALPEDVCAHVKALLDGDEDGEGGIDLQSIADGHDLTERAAVLLTYRCGTGDRFTGELISRRAIPDPETAHQVLHDLDDDLAAATVDGAPGDRYELVVTDETGHELACARVTAR